MKLNHDCIRDLMLFCENELTPNRYLEASNFEIFSIQKKHSMSDIQYSIQKLSEAGYLKTSFEYADDELDYFAVDDITWDGHQFIDNVRDNNVWSEVKDALKSISSVSIPILSQLASAYLRNKLGL